MIQVERAQTVEEATAAARSRLYRLLADGFIYPDSDMFEDLVAGSYRDAVIDACRALGYESEPAFDGLVASGNYTDFQAEYLRIFEVGMGMPPCPLYSGMYRGGRKAVMEELTRFYSFFGLSIEHGSGELPDHITTELEFMHFLSFKELTGLQREGDAASYRRAQADFLERQIVTWLPALEARLQGIGPPSFYLALTVVTNTVTRAALTSLREVLGSADAALVEA